MTDRDTVLTVIRYLGRIALALAVGDLLLTAYVLHLAGKAGSVDPVAVGAVGAVTTLLGTVIGALGAMLVSTKTGPTDAELRELAAAMTPPAGSTTNVETMEVDADKVEVNDKAA